MLPESRNTTYTPSDEHKSADANDWQDWLVTLLTPTLIVPARLGDAIVGSITKHSNGHVTLDSSSTSLLIPITGLIKGMEIQEVRLHTNKADGTGSIDFRIQEEIADLTIDSSNFASSGSAAGVETITLDANDDGTWFPHTVIGGAAYFLQVDADAAGDDILAAEIDIIQRS